MEPKFNTSFIPKKSLQADVSGTTPGRYVHRRSVKGPGYFIALLIFLASVAASVGIFGYTKLVEQSIADLSKQVEATRATFKPEVIGELSRVDTRMRNATTLLHNHVAVSEMFSLLEKITLKDVSYTALEYHMGLDTTPSALVLNGNARTMKSVALQTDQFAKSDYIHDPNVTQLERDFSNDTTTFSIGLSVDPRLISYEQSLDTRMSAVETSSAPVISEAEAPLQTHATSSSASTTTPPQ